jgi:uncharacterized protein
MFGFGPSSQDRSFYEAFEKHAACIVRAAELLVQIAEDPDRTAELAKKISEVESEGDKITHETIARLHKTWITPIDRSDIHGLITSLDDVLDLTEAVSERLLLYGEKTVPDFVPGLTRVVKQAVAAVDKAVRLLPQVKRPKEMLDLCVEINRLENEADQNYRRALAKLYSGEYDALVALKWRDIIDNLESATDRCEDVANILEGIVLEYS